MRKEIVRRLVELLDQARVSFREAYFEGEGYVRHYFLPDGITLEVVLRD